MIKDFEMETGIDVDVDTSGGGREVISYTFPNGLVVSAEEYNKSLTKGPVVLAPEIYEEIKQRAEGVYAPGAVSGKIK